MGGRAKKMREEILDLETRIGRDIEYAAECLRVGDGKRCRPDTARDVLRGVVAELGRPKSWHTPAAGLVDHRSG